MPKVKQQTQQYQRKLIAFVAVAAAVAVGLWLFDNHSAKGGEVPVDALVVDVRTAGEYSGWHYEGAINIPVSQLGGRLGELGAKDRNIIVYCRSGSRSANAKSILERAGFTRVQDGGSLHDMRRRKRASRSTAPNPRPARTRPAPTHPAQ